MSTGSFTARRLGIGALCVLALAGSALLAWWQWTRYEATGGSIQNLGYMLQWPLFGLFPAFLVWRIHRLARRAEPEVDPDPTAEPSTPKRGLGYVQPRSGSGPVGSDTEQDPTLAEYNRYLAELNAADEAPERSRS